MLPADLPEIIGGKYRPRHILGEGATGTVFSVEHTFTGELLALKVMKAHLGASPDAIARFKREACAASKIRSQHVVRIFDADVAPELGGAPYLVMDLLEGSDIERFVGDKPVPPDDVVEWLRQVAVPLDKAHRIGIVHRDLKPENLFLTRLDDGTTLVKILDFGIARIAAESPGTTLSGQLFGTPLYMAPEQARGDLTQIGSTTDLYALGHIAFRLLAGFGYRTGTHLTELLNEILYEPLVAPSKRGYSFSDDFDRWFLRSCQPDPALRFASAHDQIEALARALGLPAEPDNDVGPPISSKPRVTANRESSSSVPSSGGAFTSLRAVAFEKKTTIAARGLGMSSPPVFENVNGAEPAKRNGWRLAFFAVCALGVVPLLLIALPSRKGNSAVAPPQPSACVVESAALAAPWVSVGAAAAPMPSASSGEPVRAIASAISTSAADSERPTVRSPPARSAAPYTFVARRVVVDDPLSDQR